MRQNQMEVTEGSADSILLNQALPEIFYFKHDVRASNVIIFIGNPDVDSPSVVSDAIPSSNLKQRRY